MDTKVDRLLTAALGIAIVWFVLLCTHHYLNQRPLWLDELVVFDSIKKFSFSEVFHRPLLNAQVFPRFNLAVIKWVSQSFDYHLLSLRFLSYGAMIGAFWMWIRIAQLEFSSKYSVFLFLLSWSASAKMVYYSAELKPYSMDVFAAACFILFLYNQLKLYESPGYRYYIALAFLPSLILFSYTAYLLLIFPLFNMIHFLIQKRHAVKPIVIYLISILCFVLISYSFDIGVTDRNTVARVNTDYFISFHSAGDFFKTFGEGVNNLFSRWFAIHPRLIKRFSVFFMMFALLYMIFAFYPNIKKNKIFTSISTIAFVIFLELVLLGALKKYPFTIPRTVLFFCPVILALSVKGMEQIKRFYPPGYYMLTGLYIIFMLYVSSGLAYYVFSGDLGAIPYIWSSPT